MTTDNLAIILPGKLSKTGLALKKGLSFDKWVGVGKFLRSVHQSSQWWLGDWCNFGEGIYGEKYSQALEETEYDRGTLKNCSSVCHRFPPTRRRDSLSFSHHQSVTGLDDGHADRMLELAVKNKWTRKELRAKVAEVKAAGKEVGPEPEWVECKACGGTGQVKRKEVKE